MSIFSNLSETQQKFLLNKYDDKLTKNPSKQRMSLLLSLVPTIWLILALVVNPVFATFTWAWWCASLTLIVLAYIITKFTTIEIYRPSGLMSYELVREGLMTTTRDYVQAAINLGLAFVVSPALGVVYLLGIAFAFLYQFATEEKIHVYLESEGIK